MKSKPTIDGYRKLLNTGYAAARGMLRRTPNDSGLRSAVDEYRRTFAMLDSMTDEEKAAPFEIIDSDRIRRISSSAEATDQEVIQFLFSYRDYCEQILRVLPDE